MIGVSNLQSFIASMTQKLTLSDISDESKNYLDKAGITTACLRIKSKLTAGGKSENSTYPCAAREALTLRPFAINQRFCQKLTRWMRRSGLICLARSSRTGLDDRKSGSAGMPRPISYAVFCLKKKIDNHQFDSCQAMQIRYTDAPQRAPRT